MLERFLLNGVEKLSSQLRRKLLNEFLDWAPSRALQVELDPHFKHITYS